MVQILKDSVRSQISAAAEVRFAREGFKKATMGDIAQEAGVATGTIYKYFPNKKALYHSIVTDEFVDEFSRLTSMRIGEFAQPGGVDAKRSYMEGDAGKLLHFWIQNRLKVIILLDRSEGTVHEGFAGKYIQTMVDQTLQQGRDQFPQMENSNVLLFMVKSALTESMRRIVSTLEKFEDEATILKAFDAGTTFQLGGMAALVEWSQRAGRIS